MNAFAPEPGLTLYHVDATRSERIIWLLEELGLPYKLVSLGHDGRQTLKTAHPMGTSPALTDGDVQLVESGAIIEYIIHRHGGGRLAVAPASPDYPHYLLWLHYAEGAASTRIVADYVARSIPDVASLSRIAGSQVGGADRVLTLVEATLGKQPYFGGAEFSAADIHMHFPMKLTRMWGVDLGIYPNLSAWFERVEGRPGYLAAMAKGSPNGAPDMSGHFQPLLAPTGKEGRVY